MGVRAILPEEREQERKTDAVVTEMDLGVAVLADHKRHWYGIVRARSEAGLRQALLDMAEQIEEIYLDRSGLKALVIQKAGPAIADDNL